MARGASVSRTGVVGVVWTKYTLSIHVYKYMYMLVSEMYKR